MDCLKVRLRGYSFFAKFECSLNGSVSSGNIKIDTGCGITSISMGELIKDPILLRINKLEDVRSFIETGYPRADYSIGVNDRGIKKKDLSSLSEDELMAMKNIVFLHRLKDFKVNDFYFGDVVVNISYDRPGHSLLGMNIIRKYDSSIYHDGDKVFYELRDVVKKSFSKALKRKLLSKLKSGVSLEKAVDSLSNESDEEVLWSCVKDIVKGQSITEDSFDQIEKDLEL